MRIQSIISYAILFFAIMTSSSSKAQQIQILEEGMHTSLRGLSPVSDEVIWVSGSNGYVGLSTNGGKQWKWMQVEGFEHTDFRDIEAFSNQEAVIMGITKPAVILRTVNGGISWQQTQIDTSAFFDAISFSDNQNGILIGDPVNDSFYIAQTADGGRSWSPVSNRPSALSGEACFAASGTNVLKLYNDKTVFVTGGLSSRFFINNKGIPLPLAHGNETTGANSIAAKDSINFVVTGGDFTNPNSRNGVCAYTKDGGKTWNTAIETCFGYRSCVAYIGKDSWICCGLNGVDFSDDGAVHFKKISNEGFHVCRKSSRGNSVFFAGGNGRIAVLRP